MRLLLVRHGQSEWNARRRLQGQADIGLSDLGRAQAEALRPVIERLAPDRVVASDLARVRETSRHLGYAAPKLTAGLREIDVGDWTGRSIDDLRSEDQAAYLGWRAGTAIPPGGESWPAFVARVSTAIEEERREPCDSLLAVCHGGVIRALLQHYIGLAPAQVIPVAPASLSALRLGDGAEARLELFNYLPDRPDFGAPD